MKYLYILLLYLPSGFGRLTQRMTHYKYTHVALRRRLSPGILKKSVFIIHLGKIFLFIRRFSRCLLRRRGTAGRNGGLPGYGGTRRSCTILSICCFCPGLAGIRFIRHITAENLLPRFWNRPELLLICLIISICRGISTGFLRSMRSLKEPWGIRVRTEWRMISSGRRDGGSIFVKQRILSGSFCTGS